MNLFLKKLLHRNGKFYCPACACNVRKFMPIDQLYLDILALIKTAPMGFETLNTSQYACPLCGANDRDRLIIDFISSQNINGDKILEIAPSSAIRSYLKKQACDYLSCDLYLEDVDEQCDITNMSCFKDSMFDYVICSHVLEHIHDTEKAIGEIYRVLKTNGKALILVPIPLGQTREIYDPKIIDTDERIEMFGQGDHVRMFSRQSLNDLISHAGFRLKHWTAKDGDRFDRNIGLTDTSTLYVGEKK